VFSVIIFCSNIFALYHRIILCHNIIHHFASFVKGEEGKLLLHPQRRLIYEAKCVFAEGLWNKARQKKRYCISNGCPKQDEEGNNAVTSATVLVIQDLPQKGIFFMKHENKGRCFFAFDSKMVRTIISRYTKKYITR
jgi:hypothetical protein